MAISGERIQKTRLIQKGRFVVAIAVEMVIPDGDPSEACYEPQTVRFVREVAEHAERGDRAWLEQHGTVYELVSSNPR